jgi:hypothetical protein
MSKYIPLLSYPSLLSLDIGNIVDKSIGLTGSYEVTLSAKFYPPTQQFPASKKADKIINIGHGTGNNMSKFLTFPPVRLCIFPRRLGGPIRIECVFCLENPEPRNCIRGVICKRVRPRGGKKIHSFIISSTVCVS